MHHRIGLPVVAAAVLTVGTVAACATSPGSAAGSHAATTTSPPGGAAASRPAPAGGTPTGTVTPSPGPTSTPQPGSSTTPPTDGLLPTSPLLSDRLALTRTRVPAGTPISGDLVVVNRGHAPIDLTHGCRPPYTVEVINRAFPPHPAVAAVCSTTPLIIAPGVNRLPFTIQTTYPACTQGGHPARLLPVCRHADGVLPPLPPGRYEAVLIGGGIALPAPAPVSVVLTASRS